MTDEPTGLHVGQQVHVRHNGQRVPARVLSFPDSGKVRVRMLAASAQSKRNVLPADIEEAHHE